MDVAHPSPSHPALLAAAHDCAVIADADGVVLAVNGVCVCGAEACSACPSPRVGASILDVVGADAFARVAAGGRHRGTVVAERDADAPALHLEATLSPMGDGARGSVHVVLRNVSVDAADRAASSTMLDEMRHRLGNAYAIAMAVMSSARGEADPVAVAIDRLGAFARMQDAFALDGPVRLSALSAMMAAGVTDPAFRLRPPGFDAEIRRAGAQALMVAVGEFTVNSLKHGALAHGGSVDAGWRREGPRLVMSWTESCPVAPSSSVRPGSKGFLIMRSLLRAADGVLSDEWPSSGFRAEISLPVS